MAAHYRYLRLMRNTGATDRLRREYARLAEEHADPFFDCLAIYAASPSGYPQAAFEPLIDLARRHGPNACTAIGIAEGAPVAPSRVAARLAAEWRTVSEQAPEIAVVWHRYALTLAGIERLDEAEAAAREGFRQAPSGIDRIFLHSVLAIVRQSKGDTAGATAIERALTAAVERDARPGVRHALLQAFPGDTPPEIERSIQGRIRITRAAPGGWALEWTALQSLGNFLSDIGRPGDGVAPLDRAIFLADSAGRPLPAMVAYRLRGRVLSKMGRLADAERDLLHAVEIGEGADEPYELAEVYHNLAHVYEGAGRLVEAERAAARFVELARPLRHAQPRMMSLHDAGIIRWKAGWHASANAAFAEMVRVVDEQGRNHYWAGEFLERNGDYRGALRHYREGAEVDLHERSLNLGGIARVYRALGIADSAEAAARAHDATLTNQLDVPMLPRILAEQGRTDEAVAEARAWANRRLEAGHIPGAALATLELAELLLAAGRARDAAAEADRAAVLARRLNLTEELVRAERLGGLALIRLDEPESGLVLLRRAVASAEAHPTTELLLEAHLALADGLAATGKLEALAGYDRAARVVERVTGGLALDVDRARFRERRLAPFDGAIRLLLRRPGDPAVAEQLLDWSRRRKAAALAYWSPDPVARPGASTNVTRRVQRSLSDGEAVVDYLVLDDVAAVVVVTRDRATVVRLGTSPDSLRAWATRLRAPLVATYGGRVDLARAPFDLALAHRLYRAAVAPLLPHLTGIARLTVAPDGPLHLVPFEALPMEPPASGAYASARYVIDRWEVAYVPSVQFVGGRSGLGIGPGSSLLVVGRQVPGGDRELDAIGDAWKRGPIVSLTGRAATEEAVVASAPGRAILHFAVHARADDRDPAASHLRLAEGPESDGWLHTSEIAALDLDASLVVLSGCETVAGPLYAGEGRLGLARSFLARGARAVVATDWPVGPSAADVAAGFYQRLAAGEPAAAALRGARLDLREDAATAHPFHWAGYVLLLGG